MKVQSLGLYVPRRARSRDVLPRYTCTRHFPTAHRIAASLTPDLLALRTRTLVLVIRIKHACSQSTAMAAIGLARKA